MKPHVTVFTVLMLQTLLALAWFKLNVDAFGIWVIGCFIADFVSAIVWSKSK